MGGFMTESNVYDINDNLPMLIKDYTIFMDTSSLLSRNASSFWNRAIPFLRKWNRKVFLVPAVLTELERHRRGKKDKELAFKADNVLHLLRTLSEEKLVSPADCPKDSYADRNFLSIFKEISRGNPLLLITEDRDLAEAVHNENHDAAVFRLSMGGFLKEHHAREKRETSEGSEDGFITCRLCRRKIPEKESREGICNMCLKKGETHYCRRCGQPMVYTNYLRYIEKVPPFEICDECYEKMKEIAERRKCVSCGKVFEITRGEKEFYIKRGWNLPRRCRECRKKRKSLEE